MAEVAGVLQIIPVCIFTIDNETIAMRLFLRKFLKFFAQDLHFSGLQAFDELFFPLFVFFFWQFFVEYAEFLVAEIAAQQAIRAAFAIKEKSTVTASTAIPGKEETVTLLAIHDFITSFRLITVQCVDAI